MLLSAHRFVGLLSGNRIPLERKAFMINAIGKPDRKRRAVHVLSIRLPAQLHKELKAAAEASYQNVNVLLVQLALAHVKAWKDELAQEATTSRRARGRKTEEEDEED